MGQISSKLRNVQGGRLAFWCPGCEGLHHVRVGQEGPPNWGYNGDPERPTFTPSILVTYDGPDADQRDEDGSRNPSACCHSFVVAGHIRFLDDCSHGLRGQTVPLPDLPPHLEG